jgi:hypothetical protein
MDAQDLAAIMADLQAVRDERPIAVQLLRDVGDDPPPQIIRVERARGFSQTVEGEAAVQQQSWATLQGTPTLDVQVGDEFAHGGTRYRVTFIDPNRQVATIADAVAIQ